MARSFTEEHDEGNSLELSMLLGILSPVKYTDRNIKWRENGARWKPVYAYYAVLQFTGWESVPPYMCPTKIVLQRYCFVLVGRIFGASRLSLRFFSGGLLVHQGDDFSPLQGEPCPKLSRVYVTAGLNAMLLLAYGNGVKTMTEIEIAQDERSNKT